MKKTYNTKAIVLKRTPYKENDIRVVLYTPDKGKIELVARGAKKIKSKISGHIEPFNLINLMAVRGRQYDYLGSAININSFLSIKNNLTKIVLAGKSFRIFNKLVKLELNDKNLFKLLQSYLEAISHPKSSLLVYHAFALKLLSALGYKPELDFCNYCRNKLKSTGIIIDLKKGRFYCGSCFKGRVEKRMEISGACLNILKFILKNNFNEILNINIDKKLAAEVDRFVEVFLKFGVDFY